MTGSSYRRGQPSSLGDTQQSTFQPGQQGAPAAPGAGVGYTFIVRPFDWMRLVAVSFTLVSDSNAGNRFVQVQYPDGSNVNVAVDQAAFAQVASKTVQYFGGIDALNVQDSATNVTASFRLSGLWLEAGRSIVIAIGGVQVGDQLSKLRLTFDHNVPEDAGVEGNRLANAAQGAVLGHDG